MELCTAALPPKADLFQQREVRRLLMTRSGRSGGEWQSIRLLRKLLDVIGYVHAVDGNLRDVQTDTMDRGLGAAGAGLGGSSSDPPLMPSQSPTLPRTSCQQPRTASFGQKAHLVWHSRRPPLSVGRVQNFAVVHVRDDVLRRQADHAGVSPLTRPRLITCCKGSQEPTEASQASTSMPAHAAALSRGGTQIAHRAGDGDQVSIQHRPLVCLRQ